MEAVLVEEHCEGCARVVGFYRSTGEAVPLYLNIT